MRIRHLVGLGLVLGVALGVSTLWPGGSNAQAATTWYRTRTSPIAGGEPWQRARAGQEVTVNGVTFEFEVTPVMAGVAVVSGDRYSATMVGCNERARVRRSMLVAGRRQGERNQLQALVEVYCGATAPER